MSEYQLSFDLDDQEWQVLAWAKRLKEEHRDQGDLYIKKSWRKQGEYYLAYRIYACVEVDWYSAPIYFTKETADNVIRLSKGEIGYWG